MVSIASLSRDMEREVNLRGRELLGRGCHEKGSVLRGFARRFRRRGLFGQ